MCKNWVQIVFVFMKRLTLVHSFVSFLITSVHKLVICTSFVTTLYNAYTTMKKHVNNLLVESFYTLSTGLIITRAFLDNLFFIINNNGGIT